MSVQRVRTFLALHWVVNALLITYVATCHMYTKHPPELPVWQGVLAQHQVFVESLLLAFPGWLLGVAVGWLLPRLGLVLGTAAISLAPLVYYADLTSYLIIGERLISRQTYEIVFSIRPWLSDFTTLTSYSQVVRAAMIWAVIQLLSVAIGWWMARPLSGGVSRGQKTVLAAALVLLLAPLALRLAQPWTVLEEIRRHSERHPIAATALFGHVRHPRTETAEISELRVRSHLLTHPSAVERYRQRYFDVALTGGPERPLDVLVVVIESLRHDAFSPKSSPNLWKLREESIQSELHFPGGNTSYVAFQALLFGFDPALSIFDTGNWPPALTRIMHEAQYYRAFVGTGGFWPELDRFLNSINFEFYRLDMTFPYYERDRKVVEQAAAILDREGPFRELEGTPVFALLYLHSTHYSYHSAPEDQVFTPAAADPLPAPPWGPETLPLVRNRYFNSVRAVDRILAPLLDRRRIIVVTGDHGETFNEDGRAIHGTALSYPQTTTPLLIYVPDAPSADLSGPTSHVDILPTLLDALGISVSDRPLFAGRSLLEPEERVSQAVVSLRDLTTAGSALVGPYSKRAGSTLLFHFDIDLWEPSFAIRGGFDEMARPVPAGDEDVAAFAADLEVWLDRVLAGEGGPIADDPVPGLIVLLDNSTVQTKHRVLEILRALGPRAKAAIPALEARLRKDDPWEIHRDTAEALVAIRKGD